MALYEYDANGHTTAVIDAMYKENGWTVGRRLDYRLDQQGRILVRTESTGSLTNADIFDNFDVIQKNRHTYLYFNGIGVGDFGTGGPAASTQDYATSLAQQEAAQKSQSGYKAQAVTSADFQYNFQPINNITHQVASYTVQADGETLEQIAVGQWGDGSLWYLIAEVNGFTSKTQALTEGTTLIIPDVNTNVHNTSDTFKPYNPTELMGNVQPTLPDAPKPKKECGWKQQLIVVVAVVVAVVVSVVTFGALSGPAGAFAAAVIAGAASGAAGAVASQVMGNALGVTHGYSWNAIRDATITGAISGAVTGGMTELGWLQAAKEAGPATRMMMAFSRAAITSTVSNGINSVANKGTFRWRDSLVSGAAAGISEGLLNRQNPGDPMQNLDTRQVLDLEGFSQRFGNVAVTQLSSATINESVRALVYSDDFDFTGVATQTIGNTIGNSMFGTRAEVEQREVEKIRQDFRERGPDAVFDHLKKSGLTDEKIQEFKEKNGGFLGKLENIRAAENDLGKSFEDMTLEEQAGALRPLREGRVIVEGLGSVDNAIEGTANESAVPDYKKELVKNSTDVLRMGIDAINTLITAVGGPQNATMAVLGVKAVMGGVPKAVMGLVGDMAKDALFGPMRTAMTDKVSGLLYENAFGGSTLTTGSDAANDARLLSDTLAGFGASVVFDGARALVDNAKSASGILKAVDGRGSLGGATKGVTNSAGSASIATRSVYQSTGRAPDNLLLNPKLNKNGALNDTDWSRTVSKSEIQSERLMFLGEDSVKIDKGVWRSLDGNRQFRVVPSDYLGQHGIGKPLVPDTPHIHFEYLAPPNPGGNKFRQIQNIHVPLGK